MEEQARESRITVFGANLIFLICISLFVTVGAFFQIRDVNTGILITEFGLIAAPVFVYILIKRDSLRHVLRINKLSPIDALLVIAIFFSGYFVAVFINLLGNIVVSLFGQILPSPVPIADNIRNYFVYLLIFAGSAGICEEILFRGLLLRSYEKLGMWKCIGITSFLFGIMHLNVQNLLGPIFLGVILGFVVYKTNSIFAGMLGHAMNNAISVTLGYLIMKLPFYQNMDMQTAQAGVDTFSMIAAAVVFGVIALFAGAIMVFSMLALNERSKERLAVEDAPSMGLRQVLGNIRTSWPLYIGMLVFAFMTFAHLYYINTGASIFR